MDLEIAHDHCLIEQESILQKLGNDLKEMGLTTTVFTTSEAIDYFPENLRKLHDNHNEIGCHGINHNKYENYKKLPFDVVSQNVEEACKKIENRFKVKPVCFRGPGMATSVSTQKVLAINGFVSDFSVCPQRIDICNSMGGDIRWLWSPRYPFHPSSKSSYSKGDLPIWVIPLSCIGIPFISGTMYMFGLKFMKWFFLLLLKEALRTQKPIVYLFHSYEFCAYTGQRKKRAENDRNQRSLIHKMYINDTAKRYEMNLDLLKFMLSNKIITHFTGSAYSQLLSSAEK